MKIKLSALLSDARGKLNGSYISRDNSGLVLRNKMGRTGQASVSQVMNRIAFQYISKRWNAISEECRNQWRAYALTQPYKNNFGDTRYLSGIAMFIQRNMTRYKSGQELIDCPIIEVVVFPPLDWIVSPPSGGQFLVAVQLPPTFNQKITVYATQQYNEGVSSYNKQYAQITTFTKEDLIDGQINLATQYEQVFGAITEGRTIDVMFRLVSESGKASLPIIRNVKTIEGKPFLVSTSWRLIENNTKVAVSAKFANLPKDQNGPWFIYGGYMYEWEVCDIQTFGYDFTPEQMERLFQGLEANLGTFDFEKMCVTYRFSFYNELTDEEYWTDATRVNPSNFPDE